MTSDLSLETKTCKRCGLKGYYLSDDGLCLECQVWKKAHETRGRLRRTSRASKEVMVVKLNVRRSDMVGLDRLRRVALSRSRAMRKRTKASGARRRGGARR